MLLLLLVFVVGHCIGVSVIVYVLMGDSVFVGICVCGSDGAYTSVGRLVFGFVTIGDNLCVGDEMSGKDVNSLTLPQNARYTNLEFAENQFVKTLAGLGDHYEGKQGILPTSPQIQIQIQIK